MELDDIIRLLGEFGRYQKQQFFLLSMVIFSCGVHVMMTVFTLDTPPHRCAIPDYPNDTYKVQSEAHAQLVQTFIPTDSEGQLSKCLLYKYPDNVIQGSQVTILANETAGRNGTKATSNNDVNTPTTSCSRYVFDETDFTSTISSQMAFVCDREILKSHSMMTLMCGQMIGCLCLGPIADVLGRKLILMTSLLLHLVASVVTTWSYNVYMLGTLYLINGAAMAAAYCSSFTLGMEVTGPKYRHIVGIAVTAFWSLGMLWVCGLAWFLRDWQNLQLAASCPIVLFVSYFILVPESTRWLIRKYRYSEAETILKRVAQVNNVSLPTQFTISRHASDETNANQLEKESMLTLCKHPRLLIRACVIFFNWLVCSLTYYGLGLNVGQLSGNIYLNFCFSAIFELAAFVLIALAMSRVGRKLLYCTAILLGGGACLLTIFPVLFASDEYAWTVRGLAMLGKFGISGAFAIAWMFTSELFPTSLRAGVTGSSSFFARIGAMMASYIANLNVSSAVGKVLPQILFGALGVVAGFLALTLPETHMKSLPETVLDALTISRTTSRHETSSNDDAELKPMAEPDREKAAPV